MNFSLRAKYVSIVIFTVAGFMFPAWALWGVWNLYEADWCKGRDCIDWVATDIALAFVAALIGGAAAGLGSWIFHRKLIRKSPFVLGTAFAVVLLAALFHVSNIRAAIADAYFPYVLWLRFGYAGIFLSWTLIALIACAMVVFASAYWDDVIKRWSGR